MKDDIYYIRGLTSTTYNNYDNHIAIYLALLSLHAYAKREGVYFKVVRAYLTDSDIEVFIQQQNPTEIAENGKIYFGILITNNEVGKKAITNELTYTYYDKDGHSFRGVTANKVFKVNHRTAIRNVGRQLENIDNLEKMKEDTLEQIHFMLNHPVVNDNTLYEMVYREIDRRTKTFGPETRKKAREMYDEKHINNTFSIIKVFHHLSTITDDEDEKLNLERIYHDVLIRMNKRKREREKEASQP
ncbi:hypothetical protein [Mesobacillus foraminis]|uniref:Uncharacterized protein n=1 Tax=Mesobacillus foraminis TaxID=279826 RepID=A0A4R2AZZ6_9BACI|nr:hypothetical protein [Mesobacillus foraminis]TCN19738.1 hypothetical protein EV146_11641 [Mesobacillus foraminis]